MSWFSKKKESHNKSPNDMSPLEAVTYLCASIQLADGDINYEERKVWVSAISAMFPEFSETRADKFLKNAQISLNTKSGTDRLNYILDILNRIKTLLSNEQVQALGPKLSELIEADGIVMTSEMEIAKLIEERLNISIVVDENI
tara:strand:+ start:1529 stop:1960 length:432 start_codon:yes stop_codon:yes gene_type:complete